MSVGPHTFRLVVGIDDDNRAYLISQHLHITDAEAAAKAKAEERIGQVFAVMQIEQAYVASRPIAHKTFLPYPPEPERAPSPKAPVDEKPEPFPGHDDV